MGAAGGIVLAVPFCDDDPAGPVTSIGLTVGMITVGDPGTIVLGSVVLLGGIVAEGVVNGVGLVAGISDVVGRGLVIGMLGLQTASV